jgi:hypothetical protein
MFYTKEGSLPLAIHGVFDFKYKVLYCEQEFWFQAYGFTFFLFKCLLQLKFATFFV